MFRVKSMLPSFNKVMDDTKKVYAKYIGYYIKNLDPLVAKHEWQEFLRTKLGPSVDRASEASLKDVAFTLYYAHFAGMSGCVRSWDLIQKLKTPAKIRAFLLDSEENRKEHGLYGVPVVHYTTESKVIKHMAKVEGKVAIVREMMADTPPKPKGRKKRAASPPSPKAKKPAKKKASPKGGTGSKSCDDYNVKELRKMAADAKIVGRGKMNKAQLCKELGLTASPKSKAKPKAKASPKAKATRKSCNDYNVKELRAMAAAKNIPGRSKMNKAQLCKALKIRS